MRKLPNYNKKENIMARTAVMKVWNVELGLAVHIKSPNGKYIVIDLGTGKDNSSPLLKLRWVNINYMIITHPHLDHFDDILSFDVNPPKVLQRVHALTNEEVLSNASDQNKKKFEKYIEVCNRYTGTVTPTDMDDPDNEYNYGGLKIQTFSTSACKHDNFNNFSIITVLTLANCKVVICGDNEKASFDELLQNDSFKTAVEKADVLVAPHHGRESGYHDDFVKLVNPRITIISDTNYSDASASSKYTTASRGWTVWNRNGSSSERYCLTTRNDGDIQVKFGESDDPNYNGLLEVSLI